MEIMGLIMDRDIVAGPTKNVFNETVERTCEWAVLIPDGLTLLKNASRQEKHIIGDLKCFFTLHCLYVILF